MKKLLVVLVLMASFLSSCVMHYVSFSDLREEDYPNYVTQGVYTTSYSPTEYNVLVGNNPANDYNWVQARVANYYNPKFWHHYHYKGNAVELLKAYYKDADVIMTYSGYYFIGTKKKE